MLFVQILKFLLKHEESTANSRLPKKCKGKDLLCPFVWKATLGNIMKSSSHPQKPLGSRRSYSMLSPKSLCAHSIAAFYYFVIIMNSICCNLVFELLFSYLLVPAKINITSLAFSSIDLKHSAPQTTIQTNNIHKQMQTNTHRKKHTHTKETITTKTIENGALSPLQTDSFR